MFDFDIMATTDNNVFIENIYKNELPVYYEPPKPKKVVPTEKDLYEADTFSFGTLIGQITNKGSAGYAILDLFDEDSQEYQITKNRLKMSCKLQSAQIDKSKIGQKVKGIPKMWVSRNEEDEINNKILLDRHPYFFIYLYKETKKKYKKHMEEYMSSCRVKFKMNLGTLIELEHKNEEHLRFLSNFYKYSPVIESNSAMNMICKKIEQLDKDVKLEMYRKSSDDLFDLYFNSEIAWSDLLYNRVKRAFADFNKQISDPNIFLDKLDYETSENPVDPSEILDEFMLGICSNAFETTNYLLYYVYKDKASEKNKKILWATYGKYIFSNIKSNLKTKTIDFPIKNSEGDILYLGQRYRKETINV